MGGILSEDELLNKRVEDQGRKGERKWQIVGRKKCKEVCGSYLLEIRPKGNIFKCINIRCKIIRCTQCWYKYKYKYGGQIVRSLI